MDIYEYKHNFRFEDKNAADLTTHARETPEDSMRRPDDKRKLQRESLKERKEAEKQKRKDEIAKLKALKKEEILQKLKQTEFMAGNNILENNKLLDKAQKELQTDFIPDVYDKAMEQMFDDKYYKDVDYQSSDLEEQHDINYQLLNDGAKLNKIGTYDEQETVKPQKLEQNLA